MSIPNTYTIEELDAIEKEVAESLASVVSADTKIATARDKAKEMKSRAYDSIFKVFDQFNLDPKDAGGGHAYNKNLDYVNFKNSVCQKISDKLRDPVTTSKSGDPVFSPRVKKQWSRAVKAFQQGNTDGTQSEADQRAKEKAKDKRKLNERKAELLDDIVRAYDNDDDDTIVSTLEKAKTLQSEFNTKWVGA